MRIPRSGRYILEHAATEHWPDEAAQAARGRRAHRHCTDVAALAPVATLRPGIRFEAALASPAAVCCPAVVLILVALLLRRQLLAALLQLSGAEAVIVGLVGSSMRLLADTAARR